MKFLKKDHFSFYNKLNCNNSYELDSFMLNYKSKTYFIKSKICKMYMTLMFNFQI